MTLFVGDHEQVQKKDGRRRPPLYQLAFFFRKTASRGKRALSRVDILFAWAQPQYKFSRKDYLDDGFFLPPPSLSQKTGRSELNSVGLVKDVTVLTE